MRAVIKEWLEIYCFLDNINKNNPEKTIREITKEVESIKRVKYAGMKREFLKGTLKKFILGYNKNNQYFDTNEKGINKIIEVSEKTINELRKFSKSKKYLFIFPCFDKFTFDKMKGVTGFCDDKNVILIFINTKNRWERALKETIYHEFAHSVSDFYKGGNFSIGEGMIFEGLAEHFRENIIGGKSAPYSKAISVKQIKKYLKELNPKLKSMSWDFYGDVFYGTGKYPNWTGYAIGYYLIKEYLKDKNNIDWSKLLRKNPKNILKELV